jgi:hypothetical protein
VANYTTTHREGNHFFSFLAFFSFFALFSFFSESGASLRFFSFSFFSFFGVFSSPSLSFSAVVGCSKPLRYLQTKPSAAHSEINTVRQGAIIAHPVVHSNTNSFGVSEFGLPCFVSLPSAMSSFFFWACGPSPQRLGYVSLSMMTRLIFAATPWSQLAIVLVVICATPTATASPCVAK